MKTLLPLFLLAAAPAWADELSIKQMVDYQMKEIAAENDVHVKCDVAEARVQGRDMTMSFGKPRTVYSYNVSYKRLQWTGQCLDGFLHGEGSLVVEKTVRGHGDFRDGVTRHARSGLMLRGTMAGPWRVDMRETPGFNGSAFDISVVQRSPTEGTYQWNDAVPPGTYRPDADGALRLHRIVFSHPTWGFAPIEGFTPVPQAEIARFKREALAAAAAAPPAAGSPAVAAPAMRFKARMLEGLTPDGAVARSTAPLVTGPDKSIAIVLSSTAAAQLKQLDGLQEALRAQLDRETDGRVRTALQKLIKAADHRPLPPEMATRLRDRFGKVGTVEDLAAFRNSSYDYAIIVDVATTVDVAAILADCNNLTSTNVVDTQERYRALLALGLHYMIVDRRLDAVHAYAGGKIPVRAPGRRYVFDASKETAAEKRALDLEHAFSTLADALQPTLQTSTSLDITNPPSLLMDLHYKLNSEKP